MASHSPLASKNTRVGVIALLIALAMLGLGFASVPLYRIFCSVTGYGGTTQRATLAQAASAQEMAKSAGGRTFSIRFDANTAPDVPWTFEPRQTTDTIQVGERDMAIFDARNNSSEPVTGTASFNVEPEQAGPYFNKIQCFCFTSQTLRAGQQVAMPVIYYVDPKVLDDPDMKGVEQITLSYTFHRSK
ncbi:MAG: cytochrome c oxidase assembly protein [Croceibacterium sp.]